MVCAQFLGELRGKLIIELGRAWTVAELRERNWETLQQLWWVCVKERNRLATEKIERARQKAGYGDVENEDRDKTVQETMKAIVETLVERHNAYQEAYELARHDPTIDLTRTENQYQEPTYDPEVSRRSLASSQDHANN